VAWICSIWSFHIIIFCNGVSRDTYLTDRPSRDAVFVKHEHVYESSFPVHNYQQSVKCDFLRYFYALTPCEAETAVRNILVCFNFVVIFSWRESSFILFSSRLSYGFAISFLLYAAISNKSDHLRTWLAVNIFLALLVTWRLAQSRDESLWCVLA